MAMGRPPNKLVPLTSEQKRLAEENHKLIYKFLAIKHLNVEEWYDIAAIAFVRAVQNFNPKKGYRLSTHVFLYMWHAVCNEKKAQSTKKRSGVTFDLDSTPFDDGIPLYAKLADGSDVEQEVISQLCVERCLLQLNAKDRKILLLRIMGMKSYEAARMMKIPLHELDSRITLLKTQLVSTHNFSFAELPEL